MRTREWLREVVKLHLGERHEQECIHPRDIERQEDTVLWALELLEQRPGILLADEVGMGKTYEALGVVAALRHLDPQARVLILTPGPDLNKKWLKEIHGFRDVQSNSGLSRPIYDFGDCVQSVEHINQLIQVARSKHIIVAPVTIFQSTRRGRDRAYLMRLYFWWRKSTGNPFPWQRTNAILRRFRDGELSGHEIDVEEDLFVDGVHFDDVKPHLTFAFKGNDDDELGLERVYQLDRENLTGFENENLLLRALDLARRRLLQRLLPDLKLLIVDEAHKLKNAETVRAQSVAEVFAQKFDKALFLTATPFQLDVSELRQVFNLFALAKSSPVDVRAEADKLLNDVRDYQHAYDEFQRTWQMLDAVAAEEFRKVYESDRTLCQPVTNVALQTLATQIKNVQRLKTERIEPRFRSWMIRSLREDRREYRKHVRERLKAEKNAMLPFLVYERFIFELFHTGDSTHKAAVEVNMVSSYGAAHKGALLAEGGRELEESADEYRRLLRQLLKDLRPSALGASEHPKMAFVLTDALQAAGRGEKTLIFCSRIETLEELKRTLTTVWQEKVLDGWQRALPSVARDEIFDEQDNEERSRGRHGLLQARFHRPQDVLSLALRERYLHTIVPIAAWSLERLPDLVGAANRKLRQSRVNKTSAERPDYRLIKRCVEQAAVNAWAAAGCPGVKVDLDYLSAIVDGDFIELGLDLKAGGGEGDERGEHTPQWEITTESAALVIGHANSLWTHCSAEMKEVDRVTRVELVERLSRFLTRKEVMFLPELLVSAAAAGLDVSSVESKPMLDFVDQFWSSDAGRPWLERVRELIVYFVRRQPEEQKRILNGALKTGDLVRHTKDGDSRDKLGDAFNTPLYPMILIANEVMQEGLDLHRNCKRVVHHDLAWNPAQLEQRVGRIDRLGSLTSRLRAGTHPTTMMEILYPMIQRTIDQRMYRTVRTREKWLEFLLGARPDFTQYALETDEVPELPDSLARVLAIDLKPTQATQCDKVEQPHV